MCLLIGVKRKIGEARGRNINSQPIALFDGKGNRVKGEINGDFAILFIMVREVGDFSDISPLAYFTSSLFTITYYLPKILVDKRKVKR
jgi:hypothetical protein